MVHRWLVRTVAVSLVGLLTIAALTIKRGGDRTSAAVVGAPTATTIPLRIVPTPTATPTPPPISPAGDTYTDPTYGWTVRWDPKLWSPTLRPTPHAALELTAQAPGGGYVIGFANLPDRLPLDRCLDAMAQGLGTQQYGVGSQPLRGVSADRAWAVYADKTGAYDIDCRPLGSQPALLVIVPGGPKAEFNQVAPKL